MSTYDLPEELPVSSDGLTRIVAADWPEELDPNNGEVYAGRAARVARARAGVVGSSGVGGR